MDFLSELFWRTAGVDRLGAGYLVAGRAFVCAVDICQPDPAGAVQSQMVPTAVSGLSEKQKGDTALFALEPDFSLISPKGKNYGSKNEVILLPRYKKIIIFTAIFL